MNGDSTPAADAAPGAADAAPGEIRLPLGIALDRAKFSRLHRAFWMLAALGIMLDDIGASALLFGVAGCTMLGFAVTAIFRIEPKGRSLDEVSGQQAAPVAARITPP